MVDKEETKLQSEKKQIFSKRNDSGVDPLLECLVLFTKINGRPYSAESLTAGLPIADGDTFPELFSLKGSKSLFSRAAERAGYKSRLIKKNLSDISPLVLPCILNLKDRNACILDSFDKERKRAKIIMPELGESEQWVKIEDLEAEYLGYAFYVKKVFRYEDRDYNILTKSDENWFWGTVKKSLGIYRDVLIASFLINLFVLATPLFTMNVYDRVIPNSATETLWVLAIGVVVIFAFDIVLKFLRAYFLEMAGKKSDIIISSMIFEKIMDMRMEHHPKSIGSFVTYVKEFDTIRNFLASATIATVIDLPFVFIFLFVIYHISGTIVFVPIASMVVIILFTVGIKSTLQKSLEEAFASIVYKSSVLIESLSSIETLKVLGAGGHAQWKWEESTGDIASKSVKYKMLSNAVSNITQLITQLNTVAIIMVGVYMIKDMELTMGGLIAAFILSQRTIAPVSKVASLITTYEQVKQSYDSIQFIMDMEVEHPEKKKFVQRPAFRGDIEVKNVMFSYPEAQKSSLDGISLKIKSGEKIGIIGKIGSGKTTLQKLLLGLYIPQSGSISIDGVDINQIDPADLRKNIAYIAQEVTLFGGTVKDNIVYRAPHADDKMIIEAAKISGVLEFVNKHPMGFDMPVLEGGRGLSGGQKQSISIARAVLLDSPIVLLDEPTNSMDNSTEQKLLRELKNYVKNKTVILVTHKFSLLEMVDRLIVIDDGKIMLDGPKNEVIEKLSKR